MTLIDAVTDLVSPIVSDENLVLAGVLIGTDRGTVVQVLLENEDGSGASLEACEKVSRALGYELEVEDAIAEAYTLEVSSPGMNRPLFSINDIERFKGKQAKIKLFTEVVDKKAHTGLLGAVSGDTFVLQTEEGDISIAWDDVKGAKLKPSDAEIKEIMKNSKAS